MSLTKFMDKVEAREIACAKCGHDNDPGLSHCNSCGSHLYVVCLECNRRSERTERRCAHCGARFHGSRVKREMRVASMQVRRMGWLHFILIVAAIILGFAMIVGAMNFRINLF